MKKPSKPNSTRHKFMVVGSVLALIAVSPSAFSVICPAFFQPAYNIGQNTIISTTRATIQTAFTAGMIAHDNAIAFALNDEKQQIIAALGVLTKQKASASTQIAESNRNNAQVTASAIGAVNQAARLQEAALDYGPMGQGFKPCKVSKERLQTAQSIDESNESVSAKVMGEVIAAPGRYANPGQARFDMLKEHQQLFCTNDQADAGLCVSAGPNAGQSLMAATLSTPSSPDSNTHKAKIALINNMVGLPDAAITANQSASPMGANYVLAKTKKDALVSPAITALKQIQSDSTVNTDDHGGMGEKSVDEQFTFQVARYLGSGEEHKQWAQVLASSQERGLIKEIVTVKALDLAIQARIYKTQESMEAILASLVSMQQEENDSRNLQTGTAAKVRQLYRISTN